MTRQSYISKDVQAVKNILPKIAVNYIEMDTVQSIYEYILSQLQIVSSASSFGLEVLFRNHFPSYTTLSTIEKSHHKKEIKSLQLVTARSLGFKDTSHYKKTADKVIDKNLDKAIHFLLSGNIDNLKKIITQLPHILSLQSRLGHHASLIHYIGSNGIEIWKQKIPANIDQILSMLLQLGADPNYNNNIYGGSDLMSLIKTSAHLKDFNKTKYLIDILEAHINTNQTV